MASSLEQLPSRCALALRPQSACTFASSVVLGVAASMPTQTSAHWTNTRAKPSRPTADTVHTRQDYRCSTRHRQGAEALLQVPLVQLTNSDVAAAVFQGGTRRGEYVITYIDNAAMIHVMWRPSVC
ncbi:hypothetical protein GGX14DRAFT_567473 [Mycena pura]|uniref:Uncharacterized protein n=1 Tax=Mycena pura TaxID=153505 RepID=A0AAD6VHU4_9AGAR|nr:hypothetical protein GGX14DRAFT_567473 [Mycena pura]